MQVTTIEGIVKNGQIQLTEDFTLPEMATVYVVIPKTIQTKKIISPRLANKDDAKLLTKIVEEDVDDEI
jgi:hypothetical protein